MRAFRAIFLAILMIAVLSTVCWGATATYKLRSNQVIYGNQTINGGLTVTGTSTLKSTTVNGGLTVTSTLAVTGAATLPVMAGVTETTASRTVTSADYGKIIACSYAGATTITLPTPSSATVGAQLLIAQTVDQTLTIVGGATADNNSIIADGVLTADNVAFSTASHKIGAMARVYGVSATKWLITNASSCAMTPEAAD